LGQSYGLVILGSGTTAFAAARLAAANDVRVLMIEQSHLGGTCVNWGCVPSKTLIHKAEMYQAARKGECWGLNLSAGRPDCPTLMKLKREAVETLRESHYQYELDHTPDLDVLAGGLVEEDLETIIQERRERRETLTRKSRLTLADGTVLLIGIMHDVTEVVAANQALAETSAALQAEAQELRRLADTDMLTGCLNRRALFELAGGVPNETEVGLLLTDIDHFKKINDTFGHAAGDLALKHFVSVVAENIRETDTLARIGGEEFAVMLPGATTDAATA